MVKKNEAKKTQEQKNEEIVIANVITSLTQASSCLDEARSAAKQIKDCPKSIIDRITSLKMQVVKSTDSIGSRLAGLSAVIARKAVSALRVEKAVERKATRLANAKARATKLAAQIVKLEA